MDLSRVLSHYGGTDVGLDGRQAILSGLRRAGVMPELQVF